MRIRALNSRNSHDTEAGLVVAFADGTPPGRLGRIDWRSDRELASLVDQEPPDVPAIPAITTPDWPAPTKPAAATSGGTMGRDRTETRKADWSTVAWAHTR
jgi:hypothetical protein